MNIQVDLCSLIHDYVQPIVSKVQTATRSFQRLIDLFNTKVPVASYFDSSLTFGSLISKMGFNVTPVVNAVISTRNSLDLSATCWGTVSAGTFTLTSGTNVAAVVSASTLSLPGWVGTLRSMGFGFEILDNRASLANLVLGRDVSLMSYKLPDLSFTRSLTQ
jgi:hypothetical protein